MKKETKKIVLILGAVVLTTLLLLAFAGMHFVKQHARIVATHNTLAQLRAGCTSYEADNKAWPPTLTTLGDGTAPRGVLYFEFGTAKGARDGWNNPIAYIPPTLNSPGKLISYGSDGLPGGEGYDVDIKVEIK